MLFSHKNSKKTPHSKAIGIFLFPLLSFLTSCDNNLQLKTISLKACLKDSKLEECLNPADDTLEVPKVVSPGDDFIIEGSTYKEGTQVLIDGVEVEIFETANGEIGVKIPEGLGTKKIDVTVIQGGVTTKVKNVFSYNKDDHPIMTADPSTICNTQKFYNPKGELLTGTKECKIDDKNLQPENLKEGVTIAGIEGTITPSPKDCSTDGEIDCRTTSLFPSANADGLSEKVPIGYSVAGVEGSYVPVTPPDCEQDGETSCKAIESHKAAEALLAEGKILAGKSLAGITGTYIPDFPEPSSVLKTDTTNGVAGTVTLPSSDKVEGGVSFGNALSQTGTITVPLVTNVAMGISYGSAAEFTGSAIIESHVDCTVDGSQGCIANSAFFAAKSCADNGKDNCFVGASGAYKAADLTNLAPESIRSGVTLAGIAGNLTLPAAADVETGVSYGAGGNESTGTLLAPSASDVRVSITYGADGGEFTGTFTPPSPSDVEAGVGYGALGSEFTGTLEVPVETNVASGVSYGSGSEFTGSATIESHVDCSVDVSQGCVANNDFFAAKTCQDNGEDDCVAAASNVYDAGDLSNRAPGNIKLGVTIAGKDGSLISPEAGDVAVGVSYGSTGNEKTGTFTLPQVADVLTTASYGAGGTEFTGTFKDPGIMNVEAGVSYGALGAELQGAFIVPPEANVSLGVSYGSGSEFTGTATVEIHVDCTDDGSQGCVVQSPFFGARACSANGDDNCFADSSGPFDAANLANLSTSNVRSGVTLAGTAGAYVVPAAGDVKTGVTYGTGGNEIAGTFTLPQAAKVRSNIKYGQNSSEFTGTFTLPSTANVQSGVSYGGNGTQFAGTYVAPAASQVLTGISYGSAGEYTGSAIAESHIDCSADGSQGCVANNTFFAARSCAGNRADECFIRSASIFDAADLSNLNAGNIK